MPGRMYVVKRNNEIEDVHFDKITRRIAKMCDMEPKLNADFVDPVRVSQKVVAGLFPGVTTGQLDNLAAETAASMMSYHPDYSVLAARMAISNLQKETCEKFSEVMGSLFSWTNPSTGKHSPLISYGTWDIIRENSEFLDSAIDNARDFSYSYFGFKTLERSYLLKLGYEVPSAPSSKDGAPDSNKQKQKMVVKYKVAERPQHMLMRVAVGIHGKDLDAAIETYNLMSKKLFTHASPTLFNAGTGRPQLSSCFLLTMQSDSIEGIYDTLRQCALISKSAGGIGLNVHNIRSSGSFIAGTNGTSNGLMPMLRVFNSTARYVDQGGNKRPGAFAIYLEPWHADIRDFLNARKNHGAEEQRARDLFYALWIPDLFMRRVLDDEKWSLMCPDECPNLHEVWGEEFEKLYMQYESEGRYREQISARRLFEMITQSQIETGTPYMLYKDACNRKSNQQNLGTIKCSNLCTEIVEFSSKDEVAVCNLASIAVNMYVDVEKKVYDYQRLYEVTKVATRNLNKIIEVNFYPIEETRRSNMRHRPIGIGVQGLADAFILMRFPFTSPEAKRLNKNIFETLYYASLEASCELAEEHGPYSTYEGSPVSKGILQFDMWDVKPDSGLWDWNALRARIKKHGVRNSLLLAPMPTASTAQILGNNESTEPYTSNLYARRVLSGEFIVANQHLLRDLVKLNLWSPDMKNMLMHTNGSIQTIEDIPQDIKDLYKTVWELPQRDIIDMAADRGPYIDQSQSLNVHIAEPSMAKLQSMHFYGWRKGLKTGMYYLRTKPATSAIKFTVDKMKLMSRDYRFLRSIPAKSSFIMGGFLGKSASADISSTSPSRPLVQSDSPVQATSAEQKKTSVVHESVEQNAAAFHESTDLLSTSVISMNDAGNCSFDINLEAPRSAAKPQRLNTSLNQAAADPQQVLKNQEQRLTEAKDRREAFLAERSLPVEDRLLSAASRREILEAERRMTIEESLNEKMGQAEERRAKVLSEVVEKAQNVSTHVEEVRHKAELRSEEHREQTKAEIERDHASVEERHEEVLEAVMEKMAALAGDVFKGTDQEKAQLLGADGDKENLA